jgi:molybdopterin converting factor small subunit
MSASSATFKALFFGPFRMITKEKEIAYEIDRKDPTINDLLDQIVMEFPKLKEYFFDNSGQLSDNTSIIINGEDVRGQQGLQTKIVPTDRITFFKAAGGG